MFASPHTAAAFCYTSQSVKASGKIISKTQQRGRGIICVICVLNRFKGDKLL